MKLPKILTPVIAAFAVLFASQAQAYQNVRVSVHPASKKAFDTAGGFQRLNSYGGNGSLLLDYVGYTIFSDVGINPPSGFRFSARGTRKVSLFGIIGNQKFASPGVRSDPHNNQFFVQRRGERNLHLQIRKTWRGKWIVRRASYWSR